MYIIAVKASVFGTGYFSGFDKDGYATFQSCNDKHAKHYKLYRNAEKELVRIKNQPCNFTDNSVYEIVREF